MSSGRNPQSNFEAQWGGEVIPWIALIAGVVGLLDSLLGQFLGSIWWAFDTLVLLPNALAIILGILSLVFKWGDGEGKAKAIGALSLGLIGLGLIGLQIMLSGIGMPRM